MTFKNKKIKEFILRYGYIIRTVVTTEIVFVFIFTALLANCIVPTASMEPTIESSSRVMASRVSYKISSPQRKDIIIFSFPDNPKYVFCKRIIGLPGEVLEIKDGVTYINNISLDEDYVKYSFSGSYGPFYIPKKGDIISYDNEKNLATYNDYLLGGKEFVDKYCEIVSNQYVVKDDCYFCMGDNRDNSEDARFWTNKYITREDIIGKMLLNLSNGFKIVE